MKAIALSMSIVLEENYANNHNNGDRLEKLIQERSKALNIDIGPVNSLSDHRAYDYNFTMPQDHLLSLTKMSGGNDTATENDEKNISFNIIYSIKSLQNSYLDNLIKAKISADICIQPSLKRRKTLLICDMDSTLIAQECIDELADFAGCKAEISAITERAMRGEIAFDQALEQRVARLKGLPLDVLEQCYAQRISLNPGARSLAQTMKHHGAHTVIVSGGFTFFTQKIAQACGFNAHYANQLDHENGHLTGRVVPPILGRAAKAKRLQEVSKTAGGPQMALAIGDGANDLDMITAAGLGIAYYAKPATAKASHCAINHTDLRTALYFQGYHDKDIIN